MNIHPVELFRRSGVGVGKRSEFVHRCLRFERVFSLRVFVGGDYSSRMGCGYEYESEFASGNVNSFKLNDNGCEGRLRRPDYKFNGGARVVDLHALQSDDVRTRIAQLPVVFPQRLSPQVLSNGKSLTPRPPPR